MARTTTITVVMPALNAAATIRGALEDLQAQTLSPIRRIVVDDGSRDETPDIVESFQGVELIRFDQPRGISAALNAGIAAADTPYIARMDADDRSHRDRLAKLVGVLGADGRVGLVGTAAWLVGLQKVGARTYPRLTNPRLQFTLLRRNDFVHGSVAYRRHAFVEVGGYRSEFEPAEDYDLWLRISENYEIRNLPDPLYTLYFHDASVSAKAGRRRTRAEWAVRESAIDRRRGVVDELGAFHDSTVAARRLGVRQMAHHRLIWGLSLIRSGRPAAAAVMRSRRPIGRDTDSGEGSDPT